MFQKISFIIFFPSPSLSFVFPATKQILQKQEKKRKILTGSDEMDVRPEAMLFSRRITFMVGNPNSLNPPLHSKKLKIQTKTKIKKLKKSQKKKKEQRERFLSLSPLPLHKTEKEKNGEKNKTQQKQPQPLSLSPSPSFSLYNFPPFLSLSLSL